MAQIQPDALTTTYSDISLRIDDIPTYERGGPLMTATHWEHSDFNFDPIRRLATWRSMSGGRGRHPRFGPGGPGPGGPGGWARGPWMGPLFGGMPGGPGFGRRRRASRGDVRTAAQQLLAEA